MTTRTRPTVDFGPELLTVTVHTTDNSVARCLIGAFDASVTWDITGTFATIVLEDVGADTIGTIASFGKVSISL